MSRVMRISSMVEGLPCPVMMDDQIKYYPVHEKRGKVFINIKGKRYTEDNLPIGEEVII